MANDRPLKIRIDQSRCADLFEKLSAKLSECSPELRERVIDLFHPRHKITFVEVDVRATGANEITIGLQPTESFLVLLVAFGAWDIDGRSIKESRHGDAPLQSPP